jgi:hypothetical protein
LASSTHQLYDEIRKMIPAFVEDQPKYHILKEVKKYLINRQSELIES